jgi:hypothetical protein
MLKTCLHNLRWQTLKICCFFSSPHPSFFGGSKLSHLKSFSALKCFRFNANYGRRNFNFHFILSNNVNKFQFTILKCTIPISLRICVKCVARITLNFRNEIERVNKQFPSHQKGYEMTRCMQA